MAVMIASVAVGTAISASLLTLSLDISSKVSKELRSYGANIIVRPKVNGLAAISGQKRYLREEDLPKIKTIFWRHNIEGIAPVLIVHDNERNLTLLGTWYQRKIPVPGEENGFEAGVANVMPWWEIDGNWPSTDREILAGAGIAKRLGLKIGDRLKVRGAEFAVTGILSTGGKEDDMLIGELSTVQDLWGLNGRVSQVFVSALTTPMDEFAYKDPLAMTTREYEKWYCTGYVTSIARQIEEVIGGSSARPFWPVAETEGKVLKRLRLLIILLTSVLLLSAALGISTTMIMSLLRRSEELALMKAMGADRLQTIRVFLAEALVIGLSGGSIGYIISFGISGYLGYMVFGAALQQSAILLPVSIAVAVLISMMGAYLPVRKALRVTPAVVLKGGHE